MENKINTRDREDNQKNVKNRVVIFGNGFDLAHGLKTSYTDFINDFWEFEAESLNKYFNNEYTAIDSEYSQENEIFSFSLPIGDKQFMLSNIPQNGEQLKAIVLGKKWLKNKFVQSIEDELRTPYWNGIEELYYRLLNDCNEKYKEDLKAKREPEIACLNRDFENVKKAFDSYLKRTCYNDYDFNKICIKGKIFSDQQGCLFKDHKVPLLRHPNMNDAIWNDFNGEKMLFLNFNYTTTPELYANFNGHHAEMIYIHGKLGDSNNPMIFGYGDEMAQESTKIVESRQNEFMRYNKSVLYFQSNKYSKFMDKIKELKEFEIYILGHSCTNADRTILHPLFENKSCIKIKYFHYANMRDYNNVAINIYRNFGCAQPDKQQARAKLLPFDEKDKIPQVATEELISCKFDCIQLLGIELIKIKDRNLYIGKYPITQAQWEAFIGNNPSYFKGEKNHNSHNRPVETVRWYDAIEFCMVLNENAGFKQYYDRNYEDKNNVKSYPKITEKDVLGPYFRLPTLEEWMHAARGGNNKNREYAFDNDQGSNKLKDYAWYFRDCGIGTHAVGTKLPNNLGIHDMCGNVWEWCWDEISNNKKDNESNEDNHERIIRGGGWGTSKEKCCISYPMSAQPSSCQWHVGFRVVLDYSKMKSINEET